MEISIREYSTDNEVYNTAIHNIGISSDFLTVQINGGLRTQLPLQKGKVYKLTITGMEEEPCTMLVSFLDYQFSAGASDDGSIYSSCNQLQFTIVG